MTSPPEEIEVECPECGQVYSDWYRQSVNLTLDDFDEEYLEHATVQFGGHQEQRCPAPPAV